ncbi:unnamed protein product [Phytophthora lilii]|uniref:Unnamed protein product n=1 Tax=Phytophthora lilii TaxID=2077276 RepID=A0A9W6TFW6_9STRA|nr:unnamed protein product [Phytophthora lilii]
MAQLIPKWFIPWYELIVDEYNCMGAGGFGSVFRAKWLDSDVVVKRLLGPGKEVNTNSFASDSSLQTSAAVSAMNPSTRLERMEMFRHEVDIWIRFNHPHVVRLFGACHVGRPFFVCEYATNGTLVSYLREHPDEIWAKLHEAALGVQYLHARGVVHGDLKGNNIVIRSDKKTKVTDFGLSSLTGDEGDTRISAASHWVAPECFLGGHARPTFASNVYSLDLDNIVVRYNVKQGKLPSQPAASNDEQWQLVKSLCAFDATKRLRISTVVDELASFANCSVKVDIEKRDTAVSLEEIPSVISAVKALLMQLQDSSQDSKTPDVSLYSLFGSLWDELEEVFCRINDKLNVRWRSVFCVLVHDADISTSQLLDITTNLGSLSEMTLRCYALRRRLDKFVDANHLSLACLNWEAGSAPVLVKRAESTPKKKHHICCYPTSFEP